MARHSAGHDNASVDLTAWSRDKFRAVKKFGAEIPALTAEITFLIQQRENGLIMRA
jgi:hypothetical protein